MNMSFVPSKGGALVWIKKCVNLLCRISNPPYFLYSVFHNFSYPIPYRLGKILNKRAYAADEITLETYDGSGQLVHPDCVEFDDAYWLVATPYPYGMEEYENPSVYRGKSMDKLEPLMNHPIARQYKYKKGFHLSDPCLGYNDKKLFCIYRDTRKTSGGVSWNGIFMTCFHNGTWVRPKLLIDSKADPLLSPAIVFTDNCHMHMYHIRYLEHEKTMIHTEFDRKFHVINQNKVACENVPAGYSLWHICISYNHCSRYAKENVEGLKGIFVLKNNKKEHAFSLYLSESKGGEIWNGNLREKLSLRMIF